MLQVTKTENHYKGEQNESESETKSKSPLHDDEGEKSGCEWKSEVEIESPHNEIESDI